MSDYTVVLEVFEGPLDLLLTLVRRESLDITTVSLASVTNGYLRYLAALEDVDPGALAAFCEVASSLLLIKSRALLPRRPEEEDDDEGDADDLVDRLRAYRRFRDAATHLERRERAGLRAYARVSAPPDAPPPALRAGEASVVDLAAAFESALAEAADREAPEQAPVRGVRPHRVRLADRVTDIRRLLGTGRRVTFREVLIGQRRDREYIIVSFLAVLEMLRRGIVRAAQDSLFGEIVLVPLLPDAPVAVDAQAEARADEPQG